MAPLVPDILESENVKFTSVDVVRIGLVGEPTPPWIGVIPDTLSPINGLKVALQCKELREKNDIMGVHVELRESIVTRSFGPRFLDPVTFHSDPTGGP